MDLIYLGNITSTHGIKGELRIKSNFEHKDLAFKPGNKLIINDKEYEIKTYRKHKEYDMVTLDDYHNINEVLFLLKEKVYIDKNSLNLNNIILDEDLVNYKVIVNNENASIKEIFFASPTNKILRILINNKEVLVPYNNEFIEKIDKETKTIYIKVLDGMM